MKFFVVAALAFVAITAPADSTPVPQIDPLGGLVNGLNGVVQGVGGALNKTVEEFYITVGTEVLKNGFAPTLRAVASSAGTAVKDLTGGLGDFVGQTLGAVGGFTPGKLATTFESVGNTLDDALTNVGGAVVGLGGAVSNATDALGNVVGNVGNTVTNTVGQIRGALGPIGGVIVAEVNSIPLVGPIVAGILTVIFGLVNFVS